MEKYILVSILLISASYVYLKLAVKFKVIDKPNERSSHSSLTIRGGGILFPIAIILFFLLNDFQYPYFVLGVFFISVISFLDDIYTLSSKIRFPFQLLAVILILFQIGVPFQPLYLIFCIFFGVGTLNMFNFMDGVNGITGMYTMVVLLGFYFLNNIENVVNTDIIIYPFISLVVFGFYNFRKKALVFAGDIGSIALGTLVVFLVLFFLLKMSSILIIALVMVYGCDTLMTLLYRNFFTNESVLDPHRHHIYQKLVDVRKMSHLKVSILYVLLQLSINYIVLKTYHIEMKFQILVFLILSLFLISLYIYLFRKLKI